MLIPIPGAGESGKSTIIKQMRIIHSGGFPEDERRQTRAVIYSNIVVAFKVLLDIMRTENIDFEQEGTRVSNSTCLVITCMLKLICTTQFSL
jgi:guanine nucleotide-binding protein subunit alpha